MLLLAPFGRSAATSNATFMLNESDRDKIVYLTNFKIPATIQKGEY